jgi:hypothetical protein
MDILQLRIHPDEWEQLRLCQAKPRSDCHAAFTVRSNGLIWPLASWGDPPVAERINVRGWFPLLDTIADELLLWWNQGGVCCVTREQVTYRPHEGATPGVVFLRLEMHRLQAVPARPSEVRRLQSGT